MTAETAKKGKALGWVVLDLLVVSAALAVYRLVLYKPPRPK